MDNETYAKAATAERDTQAREDAIADQIGEAINARRRAREAEDPEEVHRLTEEIARLQGTKDAMWGK